MTKCADIDGLLKKLESQALDVPDRRQSGYAYTKRSLELMKDGHLGTVTFDAQGNITGAASYYLKDKEMWVETLGSIGDWDGKTTPGMGLLYDIFKEAQYMDKVRLHSLPGKPALFYERFEFKGTTTDALDMTAVPSDFTKFMKWYEDATGISDD